VRGKEGEEKGGRRGRRRRKRGGGGRDGYVAMGLHCEEFCLTMHVLFLFLKPAAVVLPVRALGHWAPVSSNK
jgi:hypothetical protein